MRVVVQRATGAEAVKDGRRVAAIAAGLVALVGFARDDDEAVVDRVAAKLAHLRILESGESKFGASVIDCGGAVLTVSQFTLIGDFRRGRRPDFSHAAPPERAAVLYRRLGERLRAEGVAEVLQAPFASRLQLRVDNWGPFTVVLDSLEL